MQIEYIGEHLLHGKLGNIFILTSFISALLAAVAYYFASKEDIRSHNWKKIARASFRVHAMSLVGVIGMLLWMLGNHYFEYHYVWQHSSTAMPLRYILSSFWEGQEGSFLLWAFWHAVLGIILLRTAKTWEAPVMTVFSFVQVFLMSMLLGIYIFDYKIGCNPFTTLLREHPNFINALLFSKPHYLAGLDGRGLNPLLQNYWMTIHPPVLFLGFAATLIPFAYAIAALWKKKYTEWVKPVIPWAIFGVMILGTGILMGGAWAYEALNFGGFWAWDPVENASLVPWLTFIGAMHLMLLQKGKGTSMLSLFLLTTITFVLILYSTFLTRSGVLAEASVHAFTDLGMSGQLLLYLLFFLVLAIVFIAIRYKDFPKDKKEEATWTREFWMFIGALVLFVASFQIIFTTSIPVINKVFGTELAPPIDAIEHYNAWQIPFAIIISLLIGMGQFLKYKRTDFKKFIKKISLSLIFTITLSVYIIYILNLRNPFFIALLFSSLFALIANLDYFVRILKGKLRHAGASIAHIGFGMMLLGALISTGKSDIISKNTSGVDIAQLDTVFKNSENIFLFKDDTLKMREYYVSYRGKEKKGVNIYYEVEYLTKDENGAYTHAFTLHPRIQTNPMMGNVPEPDTRHFLQEDIYTHITYAKIEEDNPNSDYKEPQTRKIATGDSIVTSNSIIVFDSMTVNIPKEQHEINEYDIAVGATLRVIDKEGKAHFATPIYLLRDTAFVFTIPAEIEELGLKFTFDRIYPDENKVDITVYEKKPDTKEFIIMRAISFPFINILWIGCILFIIGSVIAIIYRLKRKQKR